MKAHSIFQTLVKESALNLRVFNTAAYRLHMLDNSHTSFCTTPWAEHSPALAFGLRTDHGKLGEATIQAVVDPTVTEKSMKEDRRCLGFMAGTVVSSVLTPQRGIEFMDEYLKRLGFTRDDWELVFHQRHQGMFSPDKAESFSDGFENKTVIDVVGTTKAFLTSATVVGGNRRPMVRAFFVRNDEDGKPKERLGHLLYCPTANTWILVIGITMISTILGEFKPLFEVDAQEKYIREAWLEPMGRFTLKPWAKLREEVREKAEA